MDLDSAKQVERFEFEEAHEKCIAQLRQSFMDIKADATSKRTLMTSRYRLLLQQAAMDCGRRLIDTMCELREKHAAHYPELMSDAELATWSTAGHRVFDSLYATLEDVMRHTYLPEMYQPNSTNQLHTSSLIDALGKKVSRYQAARKAGYMDKAKDVSDIASVSLKVSGNGNVINFASAVGDISTSVQHLRDSGNEGIAEILDDIKNALLNDEKLTAIPSTQSNALQLLSSIADEAERPEEKRRGLLVQTVLKELRDWIAFANHSASVLLVHAPKVAGFFNIALPWS